MPKVINCCLISLTQRSSNVLYMKEYLLYPSKESLLPFKDVICENSLYKRLPEYLELCSELFERLYPYKPFTLPLSSLLNAEL